MKRAIAAALMLALAACTTETEHGRCIGIADDQDPALRYEVSIWNAVIAVGLIETVIVPVVWLARETKCPVERKTVPGIAP